MKKKAKNSNPIIVTFKVDEEMARLLQSIPNRSKFIREAIRTRLGVPCPACGGSGRMSQNQAVDIKTLLDSHYLGRCTHCGTRVTNTTCHGRLDETGSSEECRINQARKGGPLYCRNCFSEAKLCQDCHLWWHPSEKDHFLLDDESREGEGL